jgi:hypothetical protein
VEKESFPLHDVVDVVTALKKIKKISKSFSIFWENKVYCLRENLYSSNYLK